MSETNQYVDTLAQTAIAVRAAAVGLRDRFSADTRPGTLDALMSMLRANDEVVLGDLKPRLLAARPGAGWVDQELEGGSVPPGEWWVVDPAEGNVNHVHGMTDWAVTATLVRDNRPEFTVVHLPLTGETYTALAGQGAYLDGRPLRVSGKTSLGLGLVGTSQARPGEDPETLRRIGASITAMLGAALVVRVSVPATLHLLNVAAGRMDAFWQFAGARADLLPGALLVAEAGGVITDADGKPWTLESETFLAAAPGLHAEAIATLSNQ
ncbi:inositol monophosphatase family protein [Nonomuraea sediminis]|uniref:inositol monophosphatase family protein n=1 Tax=Nonomuraea sediminis TaxID=2835864 RepID=UPI001BDBEE68|nr:inositol monophosphatase family protein [Nonomuraea sediminis]